MKKETTLNILGVCKLPELSNLGKVTIYIDRWHRGTGFHILLAEDFPFYRSGLMYFEEDNKPQWYILGSGIGTPEVSIFNTEKEGIEYFNKHLKQYVIKNERTTNRNRCRQTV